MNTNNMAARMAGILFLVATASYIAGDRLIGAVIHDANDLLNAYPNSSQIMTGGLLEFINSAAVVGIAIFLFPILKQHNESIAIGYIAFRVMEAVILIVGTLSALLLIIVSQGYIEAGNTDAAYFQTIGSLAVKVKYFTFQLAMLTLGLYSLLFCYVLYKSKLVPRFISILGFIGYASLLASALSELFGYSLGSILFIPGALFEIILPIWLIVKGVHSSVLAVES